MRRIFLSGGIALLLCSCNVKNKHSQNINVDTVTSIAMLDEMQKLHPGDKSIYNRKAMLLLSESNVKEAFANINAALRIDSLDPKLYITLADVFFAMNSFQKSQNTLEKAFSLAPNDTTVQMKLAKMYLYLRKYPQTLQMLDTILLSAPGNAYVYLLKGFTYKEIKDTSSALKNFNKASILKPDITEAYIQLGLIYAQRKDKAAVGFYEKALKINPKCREALYNTAYFYQETGDYLKAIDKYNDLILKTGTDKYAYYNIGFIYLEYLKDLKKAAQYFSNAIDADQYYVEAYFNRGLSYEKDLNFNAARKDYQKALELRPNYEKAADALKRIKSK